jgi:hypothetical protein
MPKFKSKTIIEYISSKSKQDIKYQNEDQYTEDLQEKLDQGYQLLSLKSDNGLGYDLLSFSKLEFDSASINKVALVKTYNDECLSNSESNFYKINNEKYGEDFGLTLSQGESSFFAETLNFFGGSFGGDVYFEKLGIGKPNPEYTIDIKGEWNNLDGDIFVGSDGVPVVYIDGKTIYSKLPVEVLGTSSDWNLVGAKTSEAISKTFQENQTSC